MLYGDALPKRQLSAGEIRKFRRVGVGIGIGGGASTGSGSLSPDSNILAKRALPYCFPRIQCSKSWVRPLRHCLSGVGTERNSGTCPFELDHWILA